MRSIWLAALLVPLGGTAVAYEEPDYTVVESFDDFEVRRYAPRLVAEAEVPGGFDDVGNEAFRILFGFISGENRASEKIAMTVPVTQAPSEGEKIAMTAPVTQTPLASGEGEERYVFRFYMPSRYTRETLPEPKDPRVVIRELPARSVAVRRFSGFWSRSRYEENERALLAGLERAGLEPSGEPVFARYDSPFKLWFLRRNEVWVPVAP